MAPCQVDVPAPRAAARLPSTSVHGQQVRANPTLLGSPHQHVTSAAPRPQTICREDRLCSFDRQCICLQWSRQVCSPVCGGPAQLMGPPAPIFTPQVIVFDAIVQVSHKISAFDCSCNCRPLRVSDERPLASTATGCLAR